MASQRVHCAPQAAVLHARQVTKSLLHRPGHPLLPVLTLQLPMAPQVRKATDKITLPIILEIIDNMNFGPQYRKIPASEAKNR